MTQYLSLLNGKLDIVISVLGLILGILITSLYLISSTIHLLTLGTALSLASLTYLIIRNRKENLNSIGTPIHLKSIFEIAFFILFILSLLLLHSSENRPILYFLFLSICAALVAISILNIRTRWDSYLQIAKIFMISFNLRYSIFYQYKGSGVDYWAHLKMNNLLSQIGYIDILPGKESFFPIMHIQVAINKIITDISIKDASNFAVIIPLVISSICVYLVARRYYDEKVGLLAMLIVNITDFQILWGVQPQTTSFGICLYYFILFILFRGYFQNGGRKWIILALIFIPTIIITHAVSSFILFTVLIGLLTGSLIYLVLFNRKESTFFIPIVLLYGITLLLHWFNTLYNERGDASFFDVIVSTLNYYTKGYASFLNRPETVASYAKELPSLIERIADTMGITLLIFLSIIGCLFWLSLHYRNKSNFSMVICTVLLLGITFGFPLFGLRNIIPSRWFAFIYFFLSIMAAFAIVHITKRFHKPKYANLFTAIIIFSLAIFMSSCTISNQDSPLWLEKSTISTTYTIQEVKGAETITSHSERTFSDSRYGSSVLGIFYGLQHNPLDSMDLSNRVGDLFIWRNYMEKRPIRIFTQLEGYYKSVESNVILGSEYHKELNLMNKVYENDDIIGYLLIDQKVG